jgi:Spy/CpxP family protein refolding chaperone
MQHTTESMQVDIINGTFSSVDASAIIRGMIEVKVKFHEDKISRLSNMEEIKMREQRIKELQRMQSKIQEWLKAHGEQANLELTLSVG